MENLQMALGYVTPMSEQVQVPNNLWKFLATSLSSHTQGKGIYSISKSFALNAEKPVFIQLS